MHLKNHCQTLSLFSAGEQFRRIRTTRFMGKRDLALEARNDFPTHLLFGMQNLSPLEGFFASSTAEPELKKSITQKLSG